MDSKDIDVLSNDTALYSNSKHVCNTTIYVWSMAIPISNILTKIAHIIFGFLTVFAPIHISIIMFLTFIIYELDEDWKISDDAYKDIREYGIGLALGVLVKFLEIIHL